jgi:hypothetical protein
MTESEILAARDTLWARKLKEHGVDLDIVTAIQTEILAEASQALLNDVDRREGDEEAE